MSNYYVPVKWVKSEYTGDKAKHVRDLASVGLGYIILESDKNGVTAAFRVAENKELGYAMTELSEYEVERMDAKLKRMQGIPQGV